METKARYYKCALQVNSYGYAKYRGHTIEDEEAYNSAIVKHCKKNNISVVGLADHGAVDSSESLRRCLSDAGIVVFPGFEIATAEKIHIVCLFPSEYDSSKLNRILGGLGLASAEKGTDISKEPCLTIAKCLKENGGFWYAAHITGDNGILKLGKNQHIWTDDLLIAAQIPHSRDEIDPSYKNIINNNDSAYRRSRKIAFINASDIEKAEDLDQDNASVLVKMTTPNFQNFCTAFKDPDSRIRLNSERENTFQSSIDKITISGGYLDDLNVSFSENLATIIGGRGTGKSTLISAIRYALGLHPVGKSAENDFDRMIKQNLGNETVIHLEVTSNAQYGQKYNIIKRFKQSPVITTSTGEVVNLSIEDILPTIEIYGQNEIIEIANDESKIKDVAERLFSINPEFNREVSEKHTDIVNNGKEISNINQQLSSDENLLEELPRIQERLKYYENAGLKDKLSIFERLSREEGQFDAIKDSIPPQSDCFKKMIVRTYEAPELIKLSEKIKLFNDEIDSLNKRYKELLQNLISTYSDCKNKWTEGKSKYDSQLKESLRSMDGIQDKSSQEIVDEYSNFVKRIEQCRPLQEKNNELQKELVSKKEKRRSLIEAYKQACDARNKEIQKILKQINKKKLNGAVKLSIKFGQNKKGLIDFLVEKLNGVGEKSLSPLNEYNAFDVFTFVEDCRAGSDKLQSTYNLYKSVADKIIKNLNDNDYLTIENMQLDDIVEIELRVGEKYKKIKYLSKGQQCTAILNLLLLDNKDPLIIDQPEDNLDNSFIADNLVATLRKNKIKRQYIFATHNANIPVFGDAEQIITMEESDGVGSIASGGIGSIDDSSVRNWVINILEGGSAAFKMREDKYGI